MSDFTKPTVFNPRTAMDRINELEATVNRQAQSIIKMQDENTNLRIEIDKLRQLEQIISTQADTIKMYTNVVMMLDTELKALKGETT